MAVKGNIEAKQLGIGDVLRYNRLVVPPNQREYAWEEGNVLDLFQDFATAIGGNENPLGVYFLGTIVLTQGEDGQLEVSAHVESVAQARGKDTKESRGGPWSAPFRWSPGPLQDLRKLKTPAKVGSPDNGVGMGLHIGRGAVGRRSNH